MSDQVVERKATCRLEESLGGSFRDHFDLPTVRPPFVEMFNPRGDRPLLVPDELHWTIVLGLLLGPREPSRFRFKVQCDKQKRAMIVCLASDGELTLTRSGQQLPYRIQWASSSAQAQWMSLRAQLRNVLDRQPVLGALHLELLLALLKNFAIPASEALKIEEQCCRFWTNQDKTAHPNAAAAGPLLVQEPLACQGYTNYPKGVGGRFPTADHDSVDAVSHSGYVTPSFIQAVEQWIVELTKGHQMLCNDMALG